MGLTVVVVGGDLAWVWSEGVRGQGHKAKSKLESWVFVLISGWIGTGRTCFEFGDVLIPFLVFLGGLVMVVALKRRLAHIVLFDDALGPEDPWRHSSWNDERI